MCLPSGLASAVDEPTNSHNYVLTRADQIRSNDDTATTESQRQKWSDRQSMNGSISGTFRNGVEHQSDCQSLLYLYFQVTPLTLYIRVRISMAITFGRRGPKPVRIVGLHKFLLFDF